MYNYLSIALSASVPLHIMRLKEKGGPDKEDFIKCKEFSDILAEKGDRLLFPSRSKKKKEGETAMLFNRLSHSIAVLSFCPGGITIFGNHYETKKEIPSP